MAPARKCVDSFTPALCEDTEEYILRLDLDQANE